MASQKQQLMKALSQIRRGLQASIEGSEKLNEPAFTVRSRDICITNPDIRKDVSKKELIKGAESAAYLTTDVILNPQNYTSKALKNKLSQEVVRRTAGLGADYVRELLPPQLRKQLDLTLKFGDMTVKDVVEGGRPTVGVGYERPIGRGGTARLEGRYNPRSGESYVGANIRIPLGGKAKGGKVKQYAKGGGVRKPRLK